DRLGRTITFYLSHVPQGAAQPLPLAVFVQGSGATSVFRQRDGKVYGGLHMLVRDAAKGRARVLAVEKPGVQFGDDPQDPGSPAAGRRSSTTSPSWPARGTSTSGPAPTPRPAPAGCTRTGPRSGPTRTARTSSGSATRTAAGPRSWRPLRWRGCCAARPAS